VGTKVQQASLEAEERPAYHSVRSWRLRETSDAAGVRPLTRRVDHRAKAPGLRQSSMQNQVAFGAGARTRPEYGAASPEMVVRPSTGR